MSEVFPDAQFSPVVDQKKIVCVGDILIIFEKANEDGDVHQTHKFLGGVLSTMIMRNCSTNPMTPEDLSRLGVENELVGLKTMSMGWLTKLDEKHKDDPKNHNYSLPSQIHCTTLVKLQGILGMLAATLSGKELNEDGSPVSITNLQLALPGYTLLKEWLGGDPNFLRNLKNRLINRMAEGEFRDMEYCGIRDGTCGKEDDRWLIWVLGLRALLFFEPMRSPFGTKMFDLTTMGLPADQPADAQGNTLGFDSTEECAPKIISACQRARGPNYDIRVQVYEELAAAMRLFVVVNVVLEGALNKRIFGPDQHRFECGDKTNQTVLVLWMVHNSDDLTKDSNGDNVCVDAVCYGANNTPAEAESAWGALMLRVTHAALVVLHE